ncbi:PREDICTED: probable WRKY transcription factor 40 [Ipomoea nil]|uniref:probable WRKY transcription factor 40 n=1 Tax=Ipomoea nil TaxID=35883 RepID=UPI0009014E16|nr:PREDICTED: probable WRKY transcription factor 40 [Ipomoea nil]
MEFTSLVDTSLGLNAKPIRVVSGRPKQEVESSFIGLRMNIGNKDEAGELMEELNRVSAENRKLSEMLTVVCGNYNALREQVREYMNKQQQSGSINGDNSQVIMGSRKRKSTSNNNNNVNSESSSSDEDSAKKPRRELEQHHIIKANTSKVYVKTEASDTSLIVKDGYQWRKYGQKVTRDNPCPRAYFRCSFAPSCPVKKKVQRSVEDQSILVATYEGEHNHDLPSKLEQSPTTATAAGRSLPPVINGGSATAAASLNTQPRDLTPPKTAPSSVANANGAKTASTPTAGSSLLPVDRPDFQQFFIEQMASSLTKDPTFKAAIAAAISGKFPSHNNREKW